MVLSFRGLFSVSGGTSQLVEDGTNFRCYSSIPATAFDIPIFYSFLFDGEVACVKARYLEVFKGTMGSESMLDLIKGFLKESSPCLDLSLASSVRLNFSLI